MLYTFTEWLTLNESKQDIIGLRYPEVVAKILQDKFGKYAFTIAKWFREYKLPRYNEEFPENWWLQATGDYRKTPSLFDLTFLYNAATDHETYKNALEKLELSYDDDDDDHDLDEQKQALKRQIEDRLLSDFFFKSYSVVNDLVAGKLKNLAPYKNLSFEEAQRKHDQKNVFKDTEPIKSYPNGYRWINVGRRCIMVADMMRNCGSVGLMSMDSEATLLVLFGPDNHPHAIVTYSPNHKRISGDEGGASTKLKPEYHQYVLDLANLLGAEFDAHKSKSKLLAMKYWLKDKATDLQQIKDDTYDQLFSFKIQNIQYYSNGYVVITDDDLKQIQSGVKQGQIKLKIDNGNLVKDAFNYMNQPILAGMGIKYLPLRQFTG